MLLNCCSIVLSIKVRIIAGLQISMSVPDGISNKMSKFTKQLNCDVIVIVTQILSFLNISY